MPLPNRPQRYCDPASLVEFFPIKLQVRTPKLSLAGPANVRSMACLVNGPIGANVPKTVAVESRRDPVNVKATRL